MRRVRIPGLTLIVALAATLVIATSGAVGADDPLVTCQMTSERVLKPFLGRLAAALEGQRVHADETAKRVARQSKYIADLRASRTLFDERRDADLAAHDDRIRAAEAAIFEIARKTAERLGELAKELATAEAAGDGRKAEHIRAAIADLRAKFARGEVTGYAPPLGFGQSTEGFRRFIDSERKARAKTAAAHAAGDVPLYLAFLGFAPTWKGVEKLIAEEEARRADTLARKDSFYMPSLGFGLTGEKIDLYVKERQDELAEARAQIAAGTFHLYVPTLGHGADRNYVLNLIGKAEASLREVRNGWGNGKYTNYNDMVGHTISKRKIDENILAAEKDLTEYIAAGNDAAAYVPELGHTTTGTRILERRKASTKQDELRKIQEAYRHWRNARDGVIAKKREAIAHWQKVLARHREIWAEDIRKREEDLAGRLARALAETPCGGGSPAQALVDRHTSVLDRLGESEAESACRRAVYGDGVYVTPGGATHGSPRDALLDALADTDLLAGTPPEKAPMSTAEAMLVLKDLSDWLAGWKDAGEFGVNRVALDRALLAIPRLEGELQKLAGLVDARRMGQSTFNKRSRKLMSQVTEALNGVIEANGYFLSSDFGRVIDAFENSQLEAAARRSPQAREALAKLHEMRAAAFQLNEMRLPRMANMLNDLGRVTEANLDAARSVLKAPVTRAQIGSAWGNMSGVDRTLFVLSVAAAAAEAKDRIDKGMAAPEAVYRSGVNLVVELGIGVVPITAAAQATSLVIFQTMAYMTGDEALAEVNVEKAAKAMAQAALDRVAEASAALGEATAASEITALDNSADRQTIERTLGEAESRLNGARPGSARAAALMKSRAELRRLLRAKDRAEAITRLEHELAAAELSLHVQASRPDTDLGPYRERVDRLRAELEALRANDC